MLLQTLAFWHVLDGLGGVLASPLLLLHARHMGLVLGLPQAGLRPNKSFKPNPLRESA